MGGEATGHKSRLYLAMDIIHQGQSATFVAIKILKAKSYPGRNPNGLEIHCLIERGAVMTPVTEWARLTSQDRERARQRYASMDTMSQPMATSAQRQPRAVGGNPGEIRTATAGPDKARCDRCKHLVAGACAPTGQNKVLGIMLLRDCEHFQVRN